MNELKNKYKKTFDKIDLTDEESSILKEEVIKKYYKKQKTKKIIYSLLIIFSIIIVGTGITYAHDIEEQISHMITKVKQGKTSQGLDYYYYSVESDSHKVLNYEAKLEEPKCDDYIDENKDISENEKCYTLYTYEELEKKLGIKLLKSDLFKEKRILLRNIKYYDGKIGAIELFLPNPMLYTKKSAAQFIMTIYIRTKYSRATGNTLWGHNITDKKVIKEYKLKKLGATVYGNTATLTGRNLFLEYDDIVYRFRISMPNGLEIDVNDDIDKQIDQIVQELLESLHY